MKTLCLKCGRVRYRYGDDAADMKSYVCQKCAGNQYQFVTCPRCGKVRRYTPFLFAQLRSDVCKACQNEEGRAAVTCPDCGEVRTIKASTSDRMKTEVCFECWTARRTVEKVRIVCPHCGREKWLIPAEAKKLTSETCLHCPRYSPAEMPENYDSGYVLGTVLGDGSLLRVRCQKNGPKGTRFGVGFTIVLTVTDLAFAEKFRGHLGVSVGREPSLKCYTCTKKASPEIGMPAHVRDYWRVRISSRRWYDYLKPYKKDRKFDDIPERNEEFRRGFLQGLIDSEGYINWAGGYLDITNKDLGLLDVAVRVMITLGHSAKVYGPYPYARGVAHLRVKIGDFTKTKSEMKT